MLNIRKLKIISFIHIKDYYIKDGHLKQKYPRACG